MGSRGGCGDGCTTTLRRQGCCFPFPKEYKMKVQSKVQNFPAMGSVPHDDGYFINKNVLKIVNKIRIREQ